MEQQVLSLSWPLDPREVQVRPVWIAFVPFLWLGEALLVRQVMSRRGFHPVPWLAVGLLLGPAVWPFAVIEIVSGLPTPKVIRRGRDRSTGMDVVVLFERNALPGPLARQAERLLPHRRRLVLARVVKAGGPVAIEREAAEFLDRVAGELRADDAELQILYGEIEDAVKAIRRRREFAIVLRADHPDELYDGDGTRQTVRCLRDASAA